MSEKNAEKSKDKKGNTFQNKPTPYIVFDEQLVFTTKKVNIKNELEAEHTITPETVKIRLLTDSKTKESRWMAFVENFRSRNNVRLSEIASYHDR